MHDKWISSVKMPSLCPRPFNKLKIKLLKFFTCYWVRHKITEQTTALHPLTCPAGGLAIQQIKIKIVEVLYLLLSSAQNHRADKCITSLNMPGFCPGRFNELKWELLKFYPSCWVRHKITEQTGAWNRFRSRLVPTAIQRINIKIVEVLYLLLSSAQNHWADRCITSLNMPRFCPGRFNELKIKLLKFFTSCWVRFKITGQTSALPHLTCPACTPGQSTN